MNIFIIPSWYPSTRDPVAGIFFREQALAIGELNPEFNVAISLWGQIEYKIHLKNLFRNVSLLRKFFHNRASSIKNLRKNVIEYTTPVITWSDKLHGWERDPVIAANQSNFNMVIKDLGKIDIIHAFSTYPGGWAAMRLSEMTGIPYLITEHMGPFPFKHFLRKGKLIPAIDTPLRKACTIVAVSPSLAEKIQSYGLKAPVFIPNMVDEKFFSPTNKTCLPKKTFFTLGNMTTEKGIPDLLHAVALVVIKNKDVLFKIGGGGKDLNTYRSLAQKLGINSYIQWQGPLSREEARREFQSCDAFILPSRHESFGIVLAEATACGKPVIATRCGGPECIVNEKNGILIDVGAVDQMAEAVLWMVENIGKYDFKIIRNDFLSKFSRKVVTTQIINMYEKCSNPLNSRINQ